MTPAVSVCIPTYNGERFIGQAIESVLKQTFTNFELIVVDDASTDGTAGIVNQFSYSCIRLIQNSTNLGLAGNWNKALGSCTAPLIKLLCHDDLLYESCLAEQVTQFADSAVGLVSARRDVIDEAGRTVMRARGAKAGRRNGLRMIREIVRSGTNPLGEPSAVMFRAELLRRVNGFRDGRPYMIDVDFYCRLLKECDAVCLPQTLCAFRVSRGALSSQLSRSQAEQAKSFFAELASENPETLSLADLRTGQRRAMWLALARRLAYRWLFR